MVKLYKIQSLKITLFVALAIYVATKLLGLTYREPFQNINDTQKYGFEPVECWFGETSAPPRTECYYMHVPEDHTQKIGKVIAFPVVVFRSNSIFSTKAPVLHLGAGGPGAPMPFGSIQGINAIWDYHNELSINQGRDFFVIDPRGAGLSKPLLTCDTFVENETKRLKDNLSFTEQREEANKDFLSVLLNFKGRG
jgi:hypothetical protein